MIGSALIFIGMVEAITLPRVVVKRARGEASRLGVTIEEYFLDLVSRDLDPAERSVEYLLAAEELLQ